MPPFSEFSSSFQNLWSWIALAPSQRRHPLKTPTVITTRDGLPNARTMVLRDTLSDALIFFTDLRSPKTHELQHNPHAVIHCYDPRSKLQLRFRAHCSIVKDHPELGRWKSIGLNRFEDYGSTLPPGSFLSESTSSPATLDIARKNFCVLQAQISSIDLLKLSRAGHQRIEWTRLSSGWECQQLVP